MTRLQMKLVELLQQHAKLLEMFRTGNCSEAYLREQQILITEMGFGGNKNMKKYLINNTMLNTLSIDEILYIFDDASNYGFEIIIEDGKFYYLE